MKELKMEIFDLHRVKEGGFKIPHNFLYVLLEIADGSCVSFEY